MLRSLASRGEWEVSSRQVGDIVALSRVATVVLVLPAATLTRPIRDLWMVSLTGSLLGIGLGYAVASLAAYGPDQDAYGIVSALAGPRAARVISLGMAAFFGWLGIVELRELSELFRSAVLSETPVWVLAGSAGAVAVWMAILGPVGIARTTDVVLPAVLGSFALLFPFLAAQVQVRRLTPLLESGVWRVLEGVPMVVAWFGEVLLVLQLLPHVRDPWNLRRAVVKGQAVAAVILVVASTLSVAVLGPRGATESLSPVFVLARSAHLVRLHLERFEIIVLAAWVGAEVLKGAVLTYAAAASLVRAVRPGVSSSLALAGPDGPAVLIAVGAAVVVGSTAVARNVVELRLMGLESVPYRTAFSTGLPLALLVLARVRRRGGAPST